MVSVLSENISFAYGKDADLFSDLNLCFDSERHGLIALVGASGSGKSTLLRLIAGLEPHRSGRITIDPETSSVSLLSQSPVILEHYSRKENARYRQIAGARRSQFDERRHSDLAAVLGISDLLDSKRPFRPLSGGQKQRLALLRDLSIRPDVVLLDEPCTGLDSGVKASFLAQFKEAMRGHSGLTVYVTHHRDEILFVADSVAFLDQNGGRTRLSLQSVTDFERSPPSLAAAKVFSDPWHVCLKVIEIEGGRLELWPIEQPIASGGGAWLFLMASNLQFSSDVGFEFQHVGASERFRFVLLEKSRQRAVAHPGDGCKIRILGRGFLFRNEFGAPDIVQVDTIPRGRDGSCLKVTTASW